MTDVFTALSHPVRRKILHLLKDKNLTAGDISNHFNLAKPTLSGHFTKLKAAGLITSESKGTSIFYSLNVSVLEEAMMSFMSLMSIEGKN